MSDSQVLQLLQNISERLSRVESVVLSGNASGATGSAATDAPRPAQTSEQVANFQNFLQTSGAAFVEATKALGKKANKAANNFRKALEFNHELLAKAEICRKPTESESGDFGKKLQKFSNNGLRAQLPDRNMEKGLSEIFNATFAFLTPKPVERVKDSLEAMQFYTNKVLQAAKGDDTKASHTVWVKAAEKVLTDLRQICVPSMRGLKWKGAADPTAAPAAAPVAAPAPAPAPAPVAVAVKDDNAESKQQDKKKTRVSAAKSGVAKAGKAKGGGLAGLFAEIGSIDQSSGKTAGLKHVSDKQKAYKNRSLVKTSKVSETGSKKKKSTGKKKVVKKKVLPPKCEYDNRQRTWFVENQPDGERINVKVEDPNDKVYLYRCGNCVVIIEGRLKALNVVNCKKTQVAFGSLMAVVEVNSCTSVRIQSLSKCPAMTIDKTNGCQVFLSRESLACNFVCAQSSEMNVNFPHGPEGKEEEWIECPIPEQFQHKLVGTSLVSEISDLYSH